MAKIKLEDIVKELAKDDWKVLSESYTNLDTEMVFMCEEGHTVYAPWRAIRKKRECPVCEQNALKDMENKIVPKKKGTYRVLAVDQATRVSGYAILDDGNLVYYGVFEASNEKDEIGRDVEIREWLLSIVHIWQPDMVGLEGIQFQRNVGVTTFETLARLQGILMATLHEIETPYHICHTGVWRSHCGVKGRNRLEKKRSMKGLIKKWYDVNISDDEADAIGIGKYVNDAICPRPEIVNWE